MALRDKFKTNQNLNLTNIDSAAPQTLLIVEQIISGRIVVPIRGCSHLV